MAKVENEYGAKVRGKMNKKSNEVHRVINGREYVHTIEHPYDGPASKAQKAHRSNFGKVCGIVNIIMADPIQVEEWEKRMNDYNRSIAPYKTPYPQRFKTVRQFVYAVISNQIEQSPAAKRRKAKLPATLPKDVKLQIKSFADLSAQELYEILKARFAVFVAELHTHSMDEDNIDYLATHFYLRRNGLVIAYARLYPDAQKNVLWIGRMVSLDRGKGYAKYLMTQIISEARSRNAHALHLHSPLQTVPFFQKLGFLSVGELFIEAEKQYVCMEMALE